MLLVCISVLVCVCMCISVLVCECMCMYVCMWVTFGLSTKVLSVWSLRSLTAPGKMQPKFSPLYQYMGKWVYRYMGIWVYREGNTHLPGWSMGKTGRMREQTVKVEVSSPLKAFFTLASTTLIDEASDVYV
jgi:hypothetical protein